MLYIFSGVCFIIAIIVSIIIAAKEKIPKKRTNKNLILSDGLGNSDIKIADALTRLRVCNSVVEELNRDDK